MFGTHSRIQLKESWLRSFLAFTLQISRCIKFDLLLFTTTSQQCTTTIKRNSLFHFCSKFQSLVMVFRADDDENPRILQYFLDTRPLWPVHPQANKKDEVQQLKTVVRYNILIELKRQFADLSRHLMS